MFIREADWALNTLTFHYIVPHVPSSLKDASPFQMISPGVVETRRAFGLIAAMPRDVAELVLDAKHIVQSRMAGRGLRVVPIQVTDLERVLTFLGPHIFVVVSMTDELAEKSEVAIGRQSFPILHVTPTAQRLDRAILREHCLSVARYWISMGLQRAEGIVSDLTEWKDPLIETPLDFQDRHHLLTTPNMAALRSVGKVPMPWNEKPLAGLDNGPYFEALKQSVDPIFQIREEAVAEQKVLNWRVRTDLIVTVPGTVKMWDAIQRQDELSSDRTEHFVLQRTIRELVARRTYSLRLPEEIHNTPVAQGMLVANRSDLDVYTNVLAINAASNFTPVLRLPTWPNGARSELERLAGARANYTGQAPHKLNRLARDLSARLGEEIPQWIIDRIRAANRIKLIGDAPLEWLGIDGFPLMLTADVSRIPVTPGNLFVQLGLCTTDLALPASRFQRVLVVRSFKEDDPLRRMLEDAISHFRNGKARFPDVRIVDVRTRAELVDALNSYDGAVLIYDGHGAHPRESDVGELVLSEDRVDPWTLRDDARIPPVVVLSACDTHPFGASHATAANGFLAAGARTVLGTSAPVGGFESSVLVGRLLLRMGYFIPRLCKRPWKSFRWSEIFPGLQRRQFITEVLHRLIGTGKVPISADQWLNISIPIGMAIDNGEAWLPQFVDRVSQIAGLSEEEGSSLILKHGAFVDALMYTQLGNPELVVGYQD